MSDSLSKTIGTYNKIAGEYAKEAEDKIPVEELEKFVGLLPNKAKVLDVGCAAGRDSAYIQRKGFSVVGIELSEGLLAEAKKLHPEVETKLMDMRKLEFKKGSFSGIWAHASMLHLDREDVPGTLGEFYRVLKVGGIVYVKVKEGKRKATIVEKKSLGEERSFTYFELEEVEQFLITAGFRVVDSKVVNGKSKNKDSRDINWVVVVGKK